jgi:hypothetical protein
VKENIVTLVVQLKDQSCTLFHQQISCKVLFLIGKSNWYCIFTGKKECFYIFIHRQSFLRKPLSVWLSILFGILTVLLLIATIVLAILFGIERNKPLTLPSTQGIERKWIDKFEFTILVNDSNDLCLTPYCIKAGE